MILFVISSYYLIKDFIEYKSSRTFNDELIDDVFIESNTEKDNKEKEEPELETTKQKDKSDVQEEATKKNS